MQISIKNEIDLNSALNFMSNLEYPKVSYKYVSCSEGYGNYQALSYNKQNPNKYYCINGNQQSPQLFMIYVFILKTDDFNAEVKSFLIDVQHLHHKIFADSINKKYNRKLRNLKKFTYIKYDYKVDFCVQKDLKGRVLSLKYTVVRNYPVEFCEFELSNGLSEN